MPDVAGVVLCGGQSSRMGRAKAWLPFAGELMLPRVVRLLSAAVRQLFGADCPTVVPQNGQSAIRQV